MNYDRLEKLSIFPTPSVQYTFMIPEHHHHHPFFRFLHSRFFWSWFFHSFSYHCLFFHTWCGVMDPNLVKSHNTSKNGEIPRIISQEHEHCG